MVSLDALMFGRRGEAEEALKHESRVDSGSRAYGQGFRVVDLMVSESWYDAGQAGEGDS